MANLDFGKQIGPLPLGAWVVVVAGGLGIALYTRNSGASDAPEVVEDTSADPGVGEGGSGQWVDLNPPANTGGTITYDSNEAWGQAAVNYLIAQGYSPALASSAITKALAGGVDIDGNKMSIQEWTLWSLALAHLGSPPYPVNVSPPTSVPGPVDTGGGDDTTPTPTGPKPPTNTVPAHWVEVAKRGDTISSLAAKHGKSWQETWNFNLKYRSAATVAIMKARGPNLIYAGTTIWVPK
jgi:hypothetical protein